MVIPQAFYSFFIEWQLKQAAKVKPDLCSGETKSGENSFSFPSIDLRKTDGDIRSISCFASCLQVAACGHNGNS